MSGEVKLPSTFYRVSVKALVFDADSRLLLAQTQDGSWEVPGGGWEHGETIDACIRRELREELGVAVTAIDLSTIYPVTGRSRGGYHRLKLAVAVKLADEPFSPGDGMVAARYVNEREFIELLSASVDGDMAALVPQLWPADSS